MVSCNYELQNIGDKPLIIYSAGVSCGCTKVEFTKEPILPGQSTTVRVKFDTKTVYGRQDRIVTIESNATNSAVKLRYKGIVSNH